MKQIKILILAGVIAAVAGLATARADLAGTGIVTIREIPVLRAEMKVAEASGKIEDASRIEITMTQRFRIPAPTGLMVHVDVAGQNLVVPYQIREITENCGSKVYHAVSVLNAADTLEVTDHSTRLCMDYQEYRWVAKVAGQTLGAGRLVGEPEAIR